MPTLKQIVEESDTPNGRAFDLAVQLLIIVSLVSFAMETLPNLSPALKRTLRFVEYGTVAVFTLEYLLRMLVARPRWRYVLSFFGIVDLVAILPFYVATGLDLRSVRAFRLLRVFRIFKLARYSAASRRFQRAFLIAREEIVLYLIATAILLYLAAVGIYYCERDAQPDKFGSIFDSFWWAVVTLTTVGYGDAYPITVGGRVFTFFMLIVGVGVISIPAGLIASALSKARELEDRETAAHAETSTRREI